jgi:spermidine synthase
MGFQSEGRQAPNAIWTLRLVLSLIGFTAVIAQVMLMRELLVVFYGNELALGVMLANWLLWTALGAGLLGHWTTRVIHPRKLVASLQILLAFALPVTLLAVRASKDFFHSLPGEILGPVPMFLTSCATLSILCLISGGLFAAGSRLFRDTTGAAIATATGAVYLLEAAGSGVGGVVAGLVLVQMSNPFAIAALLGALNLLAAWVVMAPVSTRRRMLGAGFAVMAALLLIGGYKLQPLSLARLWRGFNLVAAQNSVYGSLAVVETGASRSLFENGLIVMTVPDPSAAEESVHFALLEHPEPRRLLLIGGGLNGSVAEALAHPSLERIDYVELDPRIFEIAARYFPVAWEKIRDDSRVQTHSMDGRRFLKSTPDSFDVIIVNLPDPHTAQLNRFYTEEFYREAAAKLQTGGILSFQVTSSENYISQESADFLRCLEHTLRQVFPEVTAIPGDTVHFFAAAKPGTLTSDPQELLRRLRARHLHPQYVGEQFLPFRMSPDRMQDLQLQIEPLPSTPVNRDFAPVAYYFDVALWSAPFHRTSARWFDALANMTFAWFFGATMLVLAALFPLLWLWPASQGDKPAARARRSAAFAVAVVGFTELGLEILLLLGFQALYGYVYHELTILVALFMVGVALGAWLALRPATRLRSYSLPRNLRRLAGLQILLGASPLLLFGLLTQLGRVSSAGGQWTASEILFPALALVAGLLGGFQFLLASLAYFGDAPESDRSPGVLYALDLAGACVGALALSALLIPIFGFLHTAELMAAVNLAPAVMATAAGWERSAGQGPSQYPGNAPQKPRP